MSVLKREMPIVQWKHADNTFTQISSGVKYNNPDITTDKSSYFRPLPLKIYRKEIVTDIAGGNPRTSGRIFDFDRPGGTTMTDTNDCVGIKSTQIINNSVDKGCENKDAVCSVFLSPEDNARRRVRSGGMIRKKYNTNTTAPTYFTDTKQYLESRSLSYKSNSNFHVYSGDVTSTAGSSGASSNIYTSSSGQNCKKENLSTEGSFKYIWFDDTSYNVVVPPGEYDVNDLNNILKRTMESNYHYFVEEPTRLKIYPISLKYNQELGSMVVESFGYNKLNTSTYTADINPDKLENPPLWFANDIPDAPNAKNIQLLFYDISGNPGLYTELYTKMGFTQGTGELPASNNAGVGAITEVLNAKTAFYPRRKIVYYKPSNHAFSTQGAVSSGDLITRRKYNTINTVAGSMRSAYGSHTASAVAYGVPSYGYTKKDKIGYPMKCIPTFSKYSDIMKKCSVRTFANAI
jgi:hypothetical protein